MLCEIKRRVSSHQRKLPSRLFAIKRSSKLTLKMGRCWTNCDRTKESVALNNLLATCEEDGQINTKTQLNVIKFILLSIIKRPKVKGLLIVCSH